MEFISDLHPHASLVPTDPLQKARARVFASFIDTVLLQTLADTSFFGTKDISEMYKAMDFVQSQLLDDTQYDEIYNNKSSVRGRRTLFQ